MISTLVGLSVLSGLPLVGYMIESWAENLQIPMSATDVILYMGGVAASTLIATLAERRHDVLQSWGSTAVHTAAVASGAAALGLLVGALVSLRVNYLADPRYLLDTAAVTLAMVMNATSVLCAGLSAALTLALRRAGQDLD